MKEIVRRNISDIVIEVSENIDRLITIDVSLRGVIKVLYEGARSRSSLPLTLSAAAALTDSIKPGDAVLIATGWPDRPWVSPSIGENDGPIGAAVLARALNQACGAVPVILIEDGLKKAMKVVLQAAGLKVVEPDDVMKTMEFGAQLHAATVLGFPSNVKKAIEASSNLIDRYSPSVIISIEKGGMNDKGVIHGLRGNDTSKEIGKIDFLIREAKKRGILTIGIGDGGNEIGMGNIRDIVRDKISYGSKCLCPCGGGIAPVTETDLLVTSTVSNWGAYGIAASLALLNGNYKAFHNSNVEKNILRSCSGAGFIDGITGYVGESVDGLSMGIHESVVTILETLVNKGLEAKESKAKGK